MSGPCPAAVGAPRVSDAEKAALETSTVLRLADTAALARLQPLASDTALVGGTPDGPRAASADRNGRTRPELAAFLARVIGGLHATADAIARANFEEQLPQRSVLTPADPGAARVSRMFL